MKQSTYSQRGSTAIVGSIVAVVILALVGWWYVSQQSAPDSMQVQDILTEEKKAMIKDDEKLATSSEEAMIKKEDDEAMIVDDAEKLVMIQYTGTVLAGNQAKVYDFNQVDYAAARESKKVILLYFYADWCPTCKAEVPKMYLAFDSLTTDQVVAFRVNYNDGQTDEAEKELAREYGVAYQHTKVIIKDGQRILKSPETWTQERYVTEVNKAIAQ